MKLHEIVVALVAGLGIAAAILIARAALLTGAV
jgi:hypothetical protein